MKNIKLIAVAFFLLLGTVVFVGREAVAQPDVLNGVKSAIKEGSSRDLARYFDTKVNISFADGQSTEYSSNQAEYVMRNFFGKTGPADFTYSFDGSSDKGKRYAIGSYVAKSGTYTVLVRFKEDNGNQLVHVINFIKD